MKTLKRDLADIGLTYFLTIGLVSLFFLILIIPDLPRFSTGVPAETMDRSTPAGIFYPQ